MTYSAMYGGRSGRAKGKAPKSKKLKCILCQAKGHDAASCPQIKDDDDDQKKEQVLKAALMQPTLGFGKTHKTSRKAGSILNSAIGCSNNNGDDDNNNHSDNIFDFFRDGNDVAHNNSNSRSSNHFEPLIILDGGCDIGATLDHIATTITNSNLKKAKVTYQNTISTLSSSTTMTPSPHDQESSQQQSAIHNNIIHYGASICRFLIKPDINNKKPLMENPRITTILESNPNAFFVIGLGPGFFMNDSTSLNDINDDIDNSHSAQSDDYIDAVNALLEAIKDNGDSTEDDDNRDNNTSCCFTNGRIVGLYGKLDYSPEMTDMIGYDTTTQLNKLRVTCQVAIQCQLPIQIKMNPSAVPPNYINTTSPAADHDVKTTEEFDETVLQQAEAYKQVVKDLARVLLEMTPPTTLTATESNQGLLRVHLSSWSGTEMHMNHLLQAFPNNLYIGLNATIGYAKHKHLHECTFAIPMDRCILESDAPNAIPSQLHNKKKVFCHSGCVLYTAVSIAEHKRHVISPIDVLRTTAQNTIQLYGRHSSSGASSAKNAVKNGLALRIDDVTQQAREQRKVSLELQQQQQQQQIQENVADANYDQQINQIDISNAVTGTAAPSKLVKKKKKDKLNVIDDDILLAEIVSEMMIDNERQI